MTTVLDTAFDVANEEGTPAFELIPAGKYKAEIVKAFVAPTKNGKGQAVNLHWTITEGDYEKRLLFQSLLLKHESVDAQRFGRQKFKDVCVAVGINESITDVEKLLYNPCIIHVGIRKDESGCYADKNEVKRVTPLIASWNGPKPAVKGNGTAALTKEASTTPKAFEAVDANLNDAVPF
jgi:hypothetical protein